MISKYKSLNARNIFNYLIVIKIWGIVYYIVLYMFINGVGLISDVTAQITQVFLVYLFMYFYFNKKYKFTKYIWSLFVLGGIWAFFSGYIMRYISDNIIYQFTAVIIDSYLPLVVIPNLILQVLTVDKLFRNNSEEYT